MLAHMEAIQSADLSRAEVLGDSIDVESSSHVSITAVKNFVPWVIVLNDLPIDQFPHSSCVSRAAGTSSPRNPEIESKALFRNTVSGRACAGLCAHERGNTVSSRRYSISLIQKNRKLKIRKRSEPFCLVLGICIFLPVNPRTDSLNKTPSSSELGSAFQCGRIDDLRNS